MPPFPGKRVSSNPPTPRIILYQQTHHHNSHPVSLLPLLPDFNTPQPPSIQDESQTPPTPHLTHLIIAALHLNAPRPQPQPSTSSPEPQTLCQTTLTLNDHPPTHPRFTQLWDELLVLSASGITIMIMLGGAARGTFSLLDYSVPEQQQQPQSLTSQSGEHLERYQDPIRALLDPLSDPIREFVEDTGLDDPLLSRALSAKRPLSATERSQILASPPAGFEAAYAPLTEFLRENAEVVRGIDLDIEEPMSLRGVVHLILRLRHDFGPHRSSSSSLSSSPAPASPPASSPSSAINKSTTASNNPKNALEEQKQRETFLISLAPVSTALTPHQTHLSGFSYFSLQTLIGEEVDFLNVQFYNGWGSIVAPIPFSYGLPLPGFLPSPSSSASVSRSAASALASSSTTTLTSASASAPSHLDAILNPRGSHANSPSASPSPTGWWPARKLNLGFLTNPRHGGSGYLDWDGIAWGLGWVGSRYGFIGCRGGGGGGGGRGERGGDDEEGLGGVFGWEYWSALPAGMKRDGDGNGNEEGEGEQETQYWRWAWRMRWILGVGVLCDYASNVGASNLAGRPL